MKRLAPVLWLCALLAASWSGPARTGWLDELYEKAQGWVSAPATTAAPQALTDEEVVGGLREALAQGIREAVAQLGRQGGYLNDPKVRIPMPEGLKTVEKALYALRQERYADEFVATLNRAAEKAVPEATAIFADSLAQLTLADARGILKGPDDAATQYFRKSAESRLRERLLPIVRAATGEAGVTSAYKKLMDKAGPYARLLGQEASDLDGYVTAKALDGLFLIIAEEERRIRQDPLARSTALLKKVFGASVK